jgi:hypothetical protein
MTSPDDSLQRNLRVSQFGSQNNYHETFLALLYEFSPVSYLYTSLVISHFHHALPAIVAHRSVILSASFRGLSVLLIKKVPTTLSSARS